MIVQTYLRPKQTIVISVIALIQAVTPQLAGAKLVRAEERGTWQALTLDGSPFRILLPAHYNPKTETYPILLFLHGQGDDLVDPASPPPIADTFFNSPEFRGNYAAIVVAPQCVGSDEPAVCSWGGSHPYERNGEIAAFQITNWVISHYAADSRRVYVTGISLGGNGVWDMIWRHNDMFAAALPVAGATWFWKSAHAKDLVNTPIWAAHGELDEEVPPTFDRQFFASIEVLGGKLMKYTEYPGRSHGVWNTVYSDNAYFDWLFSQRR